jgi:protein-disulfide isomerase
MTTKNEAAKNPWFWVSVIAVIVIIVLAYKVMIPAEQEAVKTNPPTDVPTQQATIGIDDDDIEGDDNAEVTIIEFSDYECPFCERFYAQTLPLIRKNYIETGKVNLVFRDFPLSFHPNAQKAAEAAECAGEQGKYYEMHDILFEKGVSGGINSFKDYAEELDLDTDEFNECLDSGEMASEVKKDMEDGANAGVRGTPAFFINGKLISGAQPYTVFEQAIEEALG